MKFDQIMYRGEFEFSMFTDKMIIINVCFLFLTNICIQSSCKKKLRILLKFRLLSIKQITVFDYLSHLVTNSGKSKIQLIYDVMIIYELDIEHNGKSKLILSVSFLRCFVYLKKNTIELVRYTIQRTKFTRGSSPG